MLHGLWLPAVRVRHPSLGFVRKLQTEYATGDGGYVHPLRGCSRKIQPVLLALDKMPWFNGMLKHCELELLLTVLVPSSLQFRVAVVAASQISPVLNLSTA